MKIFNWIFKKPNSFRINFVHNFVWVDNIQRMNEKEKKKKAKHEHKEKTQLSAQSSK
jgi:hypothetical protein